MVKLFKHQLEGAELAYKLKKYGLFMEVGTGKTYTALEVSKKIKLAKGKIKVLVVCPKMLISQWHDAIKEYGLDPNDFFIINYEKITRNTKSIDDEYNLIILDEVHKLKSKDSKISKIMRQKNQNTEYILGLTGTPTSNSLVDVYCIFKNMGILEFNVSYNQFVQKYFNCSLQVFNGNRFLQVGKPLDINLNDLMNRIYKNAYVKKQCDCIQLPQKTEKIITVDGAKDANYKMISKGVFEGEDRTLTILEKIQKLHQISNGFLYENNDINRYNDYKVKVLKELVNDILCSTTKIIIVYNFKADKEIINKFIAGATEDIEEFKKDKNIFLLQFSKAEGLNLQFCNTMIFYSFGYSYLSYNQMLGRIYRNGQIKNCMYYFLVGKKTIENNILDALKNKKEIDHILKNYKR